MRSFASSLAVLVASACVLAVPVRRSVDAATIAALAPPLGATPPLAPSGFGDCLGPVNGSDGKPARVPCQCPPTQAAYIAALTANVQAGYAINNPTVGVSFPTSASKNDQHARITAAVITLQNLNGPGKGCPLVSTTLGVLSNAIDAGTASAPTLGAPAAAPPKTTAPVPTPAPSKAAAPAAAPPATNNAAATGGAATAALIAQLAPDLGATPPLAPTGFGDCLGPVNGSNGQPAHVPCACPPAHDAYIAALTTNVLAGHAVNNTGVQISFPTGNSAADQHGRITAAVITLQNLEGPGKGCPLVSTTLGLQSDAIDGKGPAPAPAPTPAAPKTTPAPAPVAPKTTPAPAPATTKAAAPATNNAVAAGDAVTPALIAQLAPDLGASPPLAPSGAGDCLGPVNGSDGKPARVPCQCPPAHADYISALTTNVLAGHAVNNTGVKISFPTGTSAADQHGRITAAVITLQNLVGPGQGCPLVSTTLGLQSDAIDGKGPAPAPAPAPASPAPVVPKTTPAPAPAPAKTSPAAAPARSTAAAAAGGALTPALIAQLAPNLGVSAPLKPTGAGDCFGPVNGSNGQPAHVPCDCPPAQDEYINQLTANALAGHAINNPTVGVSFPTGNSNADKHARITAAVITLQNLNGPGKGCPLVSTTLGVQADAIGN